MPGMGLDWASIGGQAISDVIGTGMGLLLEGHNDRRQLRQQQALLEQQYKIDNRMADQNFARQLQFWNATNYSAQVEQLKKAGLNPAMLYSKGGPGGVTGQQAAHVGSATAPAGGMEVMQMMMNKANIDLIRAQTEKTKAETTAVAPSIEKTKTETASITQGIENQKAVKELTDVQASIARVQDFVAGKTQNLQISYMMKIVAQAQETLDILENDAQISEQTVNEKMELIKMEVINAYLNALKTKQDTEKSKAEITNMQEQIKLGQGRLALDTAIADGTIVNWKGGALDVIKRLVGSWLGKGK